MRRNSVSVKAICFTALLTCVLVLVQLNSFAQDTQAPTTDITSPANNANIPVGAMITIKGTASDDVAVTGVEVSVDGGTTWQSATGTTNWTYSWTASEAGTVSIKSRGFDGAGNIEPVGEAPGSNAVIVNVTASQTGCPCSIFQSTDAPAIPKDNDGNSIEVGVKFRPNVNGYITGIRFYKGAGTTGTHTGHLWSRTGTLLASATFTNETTSGWQQVLLSTPVAVTANTTYIASFFSTFGDYGNTVPFFTQAVVNGPLKALADGEDGANGVYILAASSRFPTQSFNATNYYVDVVFNTSTGPDVKGPQVTHTSPASNATNVQITTSINADFNESIDPATVNSSTLILQDPSNNIISGNVAYNSSSNEATLIPTAPLSYSTTYKVTLQGGSADPRIKDMAGNALSFDYTWTFTTANPPPPLPTDGPGGPILIISSAANLFSRYPVEILRAEGLNEFSAMDVSNVTSSVLDNYDVVIVGDIPLSASMLSMLTNWTNAGGTLIAFHPDAQLSALLGLSRVGSTLSDKYLLVNTASGPGVGIVNQTIQYHGAADLYTLNGATSLATLYSNATTATQYPAITMKNVGSSGGVAVAFTYDLARSVVYTRQGNPAWAGQKRDGQIDPKRSDDMFFGNASFDPQPDWINLSKVSIPQADEQQHLLANIIHTYNLDKKPLPKFWFLPSGFKAAIVMTGDDHGNGGTVGRFDQYLTLSSSNTSQSVLDWKAIRGTSYIYPGTPITNSKVVSYQSQGFEIGLHLNTGCQDWISSSWNADFNDQLSQLKAQLPSMTSPITNRTHCIAWSDWASQPKLELLKGIRLDVNYYYWPGSWIQNRSGMFTGSGMPMRFADVDGSLIDCYQVTTQMPDESDETFPQFCDQLLDRATGSQGYYGVFCANMHTDNASSPGSDAIISSAQAHNVPVVSAKQMLTWLDGRNNSSFKSISWNVNQLSFSIDTGVGSRNLQVMVPATSSVGQIVGIKLNGATINYTTQSIKGIMYAFFAGTKGSYLVSYGPDNTPPVISNILATPHSDGTATITWNTDELSTSKVDYNAEPNPLTLRVSDVNLVSSHSITLNNLTAGTTYHYRVTSVDGASNSATSPAPPDSLSFTMPSTSCTGTKPSTPGTMSGPTINICGSGPFTYSISSVTGATSYNWAVPAGLNIISNSGTSISVSNASAAFTTSGQVRVTASNSCGTSGARSKTIFAVAQDPTTISGLTSVTANQTGVRYSVTNRSGITFNWSVPPGATITSGQGTNVIRVKFGSSSGNVSVYLSNACGRTATASLFVTVSSAFAQSVQSITTANSYLRVYPNPATSIATVAFDAKQGIKYEILVRDLAGKSIIRESAVTKAGENKVPLNMDKYANGAYLVTLITAEGYKTVKLYKENSP